MAVCILFVCGCGTSREENRKVKDLAFEIVREEDIPQQLKTIIKEKKSNMFKCTYEDQDQLYIAVGYGQKPTGGYSIQVKECYLSENAVYFDPELKGPQKGDTSHPAKSYPYLVVKIENRREPVVFQ